MKDFKIEDRVKKAVENFVSGYNCAQSVFLAYSDVFELELETAKSMSVSFGGGVGRMREICGTVCSMSMLAGFRYPVVDTQDLAARTRNYAIVQQMSRLFKEEFGSIICRELLPATETSRISPIPSVRNAAFYSSRPCARYVAKAAEIAGKMLKGELE